MDPVGRVRVQERPSAEIREMSSRWPREITPEASVERETEVVCETEMWENWTLKALSGRGRPDLPRQTSEYPSEERRRKMSCMASVRSILLSSNESDAEKERSSSRDRERMVAERETETWVVLGGTTNPWEDSEVSDRTKFSTTVSEGRPSMSRVVRVRVTLERRETGRMSPLSVGWARTRTVATRLERRDSRST